MAGRPLGGDGRGVAVHGRLQREPAGLERSMEYLPLFAMRLAFSQFSTISVVHSRPCRLGRHRPVS